MLYSSAITITLLTPAPPFRGSLPVSPPAPLRVVPPVFRPSRPSRRHFPSLFVSFGSLFSLPRLFPSLRVAFLPLVLTDRPVASTAAIPQLFSSFLALVAIAARRGTPHAFRYRACFTGISLSLCFLHSLFSLSSLSGAAQLVSISRPVASTSRLSPFFSLLSFIRRNRRRNFMRHNY